MGSPRILALLGLLALTGCVSTSQPVPPDSLTAYRDTLVQLNTQSVQALTAEYDWNYRNYKQRIRGEEQMNPNSITLQFCQDDFDWQWGACGSDRAEQPVFMVIAEQRRSLAGINQMMIDYANFLLLFNSANEHTRSTLEDSAEKIGKSAQSIASRAGKPLDQATFGAFATIGVGFVEQLLAKKQRDGMAAVMADFQPGVEQFASLGSQAMRISASGIKAEYQDESQPLRVSIARETDGARRLELVEKLIALNEQTAGQLDILNSLRAAYESLPGAHAEVMAALQSGYAASLQELISHIDTIGSAYATLQASDTG
jgi:hypothetical protein